MPFTNYQDLQDAVASWLNREDASTLARIPDFIVFGENRIFRELRSRENEVTLTYLASAGDNTEGVILPADYKETKIVSYDERKLDRKSDQWLKSRDPTAAAGQPLYFARIGNQLKWWRKSDANSDVELIYYNQQAHISASTIPALYFTAPELYLFGALLEAKPWLRATKEDDILRWQGKYDEVIGELQLETDVDEYSGSTVDVSNIYEDTTIRTTDGKNSFIA